jgi:hypothetical protein
LPLANSFHHQDLQGTRTPKLLPMPGTREAPRPQGGACGLHSRSMKVNVTRTLDTQRKNHPLSVFCDETA